MLSFILRRIAIAIPVLLIVLVLTFVLARLAPGNPFTGDKAIAEEVLENKEKEFGLQGSLLEQLARYIGNVLTGNLGASTSHQPHSVNDIIAQTLPVSVTLGALAFVIAMILGVSFGCLAAVNHNHVADRAAMVAALVGISVPNFVVGPLLVLFLAIYFPIFPIAGWGDWDQLVLPAFTLALPFVASVARLTRASVLDVLRLDFVRTARAKGLPERAVIGQHVLKVAILPVLSYAGPLAALILTGSIVVEKIFNIPGLGPFFVDSITSRDYFMICGTVIVYSSFLITFNLIVDVLYSYLDRRVELG